MPAGIPRNRFSSSRPAVTAETAFRTAYAASLAAYLDGDEAALQKAYDLGRDALSHEVSLLQIANLHHESLANAVTRETSAGERQRITRAAGEFLLETLSPYEMVARGFVDARDATLFERRRAVMLRQLSTLLSDASLAADAAGQYEEVLRLAADHARELTNARSCIVAIHDGIHICSADEKDESLDTFTHLRSLSKHSAPRRDSRALRSSAETADRAPAIPDPDDSVGGSIAAPLTTLDGTEYGWIHLANKAASEFTEADKAVLVHIAQLTAAALERASIYEPARRPIRKRPRPKQT